MLSFGRSRAALYTKENRTNITFDDVAGMTEAKAEVKEIIEFLKNPGKFAKLGGSIPRGVLLVGSPGTGKTLLAKAIAGEAEVPFFSISGSDFVEMFVGVGASRVRDLFKQAREASPCIVFLDEIDAVGRKRGTGMGGGHDEREQTLNAILVEMDGFDSDKGIILDRRDEPPRRARPRAAAPGSLRPPGRHRHARRQGPRGDPQGPRAQGQASRTHRPRGRRPGDRRLLGGRAGRGDQRSRHPGRDEEQGRGRRWRTSRRRAIACAGAARSVRGRSRKRTRRSPPTTKPATRWSRSSSKDQDPIHKVTIVSRGRSLGATMSLPEKDDYNHWRKKLLGRIAVCFGGRIAEDVVFGDISAGAQNDIEQATNLARVMVCELGMSEKVGPIKYTSDQENPYLGAEFKMAADVSQKTMDLIDGEVRRIIEEQYEHAQNLIESHRDALDRIANALLEFETISGDEISGVDARRRPRRVPRGAGHGATPMPVARPKPPPRSVKKRTSPTSISPEPKAWPTPDPSMAQPPTGHGILPRQTPTRIMGVVNVTPDSFWAGSRRIDPGAAVAHGLSLAQAGAQVLDVGGESTRPGHEPVSAAAQIDRILPVIEGLVAAGAPAISVDTTLAEVACAALDAGAQWINDTTALISDPDLGRVAAERGCPLVLMHRFVPEHPLDRAFDREELMGDLLQGLRAGIDRALAAGCERSQLLLDPGLGFGLSHAENAGIVRHLDDLRALGLPLLVGPSRKRFIGHFTDKPVEDRLMGTAAVVAALTMRGCEVIRVHDVAAMADVVAMAEALRAPSSAVEVTDAR